MKESSNDPYSCDEPPSPLNEAWAAKRRAANAIKQLSELLVTSSPATEQILAIADRIETEALKIAESPRIYGCTNWSKSGEHGTYERVSSELNPLNGMSNPVAPPINCWAIGDRAYGTCECSWTYEGPPNSVHGGVIASIFDQFLGMTQWLTGQQGMTAQLNTRYHKPTPLNTPLTMEAWVALTKKRKTSVHGEIYADGERTASCEALFITPKMGMGAAQIGIRIIDDGS